MLQLTTVIAYLLLVGSSCSKAKQTECAEGTDPRTGACVSIADPDAEKIAILQTQLDSQTQRIQQMIKDNQDKQLELLHLRNIISNPDATQSQKDQAIQKLSELGINFGVAAAAKGGEAFLKAVDKWLDDMFPPATTQPTTTQPTTTTPATGGE